MHNNQKYKKNVDNFKKKAYDYTGGIKKENLFFTAVKIHFMWHSDNYWYIMEIIILMIGGILLWIVT